MFWPSTGRVDRPLGANIYPPQDENMVPRYWPKDLKFADKKTKLMVSSVGTCAWRTLAPSEWRRVIPWAHGARIKLGE